MASKIEKPTKATLAKIKKWNAHGVRLESQARLLDISITTYNRLRKRWPEVDEAISNGKAETEAVVTGHLYRIMTDKQHKQQLTSLIFYCKTQLRWSTEQTLQLKDDENNVITFTLAKPLDKKLAPEKSVAKTKPKKPASKDNKQK